MGAMAVAAVMTVSRIMLINRCIVLIINLLKRGAWRFVINTVLMRLL
jgi:hypothetical protein